MGPIIVRGAEPDDIPAITEIMNCPGVVHGTLQLPFRAVEERRRGDEYDPDVHRLVAEVDGLVVGILTLHLQRPARRRHVGSIGMAVHDAFQGRGVGRALMAATIDLADNWLGLHRIELTVYADNAPAIHLYERFGFVVEGRLRDYAFRAGRYVDALAMARLRPAATNGAG
ncbi:MAG: GNAT family N-acetyltransferase [Sphaerobacter sp.]|nr:GNAT family N-acetyltransferase [Sphaerobacter sp.]